VTVTQPRTYKEALRVFQRMVSMTPRNPTQILSALQTVAEWNYMTDDLRSCHAEVHPWLKNPDLAKPPSHRKRQSAGITEIPKAPQSLKPRLVKK
jgi:hypothetical protein